MNVSHYPGKQCQSFVRLEVHQVYVFRSKFITEICFKSWSREFTDPFTYPHKRSGLPFAPKNLSYSSAAFRIHIALNTGPLN